MRTFIPDVGGTRLPAFYSEATMNAALTLKIITGQAIPCKGFDRIQQPALYLPEPLFEGDVIQ